MGSGKRNAGQLNARHAIYQKEREISAMNQSIIKGYFCIIASAVIFGCMPLGVKLIYAEGVNSLSVVLLRNFLPLPFLALLAVRGGGNLKLPKGSLKETALIALFSGCLTASLLFSSYNYISSGTATVFHFIYPAATVLGSALFLREKIGRGPMICILICTAGIALFYNPADPIDLRGSALALLSGITYATYILLLSHYHYKDMSGFKLSFYVCLFTSIFLLIVGFCTNQLTFPHSAQGWLLAILVACAISVGAVVLFQQGTFLIGGQRAAILSTFEPITSLVVGAVVFDEVVGVRTLIGSFLVVLATIMIAVFDMRDAK